MTSSPIPNFTWESTTRWWYEDALNLLPPVRIRGGYVLAGEAMDQGPVMLSWEDVREAGHRFAEGYNVVIHEFAHKIDMRDGIPDGCPPLPSRKAREAWRACIEAEHAAFRERVLVAERFSGEPTWLDPYGAEGVDEFFAVACEAYFVNPERFTLEFPPLQALFDGFFRPQAWSGQG